MENLELDKSALLGITCYYSIFLLHTYKESTALLNYSMQITMYYELLQPLYCHTIIMFAYI